MKISLELGKDEIEAIRNYLSVELPRGRKPNPSRRLMMKLASALDKAAMVPASGKSFKLRGRKIWEVVGRADLKGKMEPATTITIGGEAIVTYWRMADRESQEPCFTCGRALKGARVTIHGKDGEMGLAHVGCRKAALGMEKGECFVDPSLHLAYDEKLCSCGHAVKRHAGGVKANHDGCCLEEECHCMKFKSAPAVKRDCWTTAYQRFADRSSTCREGAFDATARWEPWSGLSLADQDQIEAAARGGIEAIA